MSAILGGEIRKGDVIVHNGKLCKVNTVEHVKPGKGGAFAQVDMSDIKEGTKFNVRFRTDEKAEKAFIEARSLTFAYKDEDIYVFMDDAGEELRLNEKELGVRHEFLQEGSVIDGAFYDTTLIGLSWKSSSEAVCTVVETEQYLKGRTVTQKDKPAILDNGARITVPCYVELNQKIVVHPEDGSFIRVLA